jgi:hypothetical protein
MGSSTGYVTGHTLPELRLRARRAGPQKALKKRPFLGFPKKITETYNLSPTVEKTYTCRIYRKCTLGNRLNNLELYRMVYRLLYYTTTALRSDAGEQ